TSTSTPTTNRRISGNSSARLYRAYLELPRVLAWAVGNANYHHVHHLSARIPNYRLREAHEEQAIFAHTPVVTVRSSPRALRLKLWDEKRERLVRYPTRIARPIRTIARQPSCG